MRVKLPLRVSCPHGDSGILMGYLPEELASLGIPPRDGNERTQANALARTVLAVASGAETIQEVCDRTGVASKSTAHKRVANAKRAGMIYDLADAVEGGRRRGTLRPLLQIVQLDPSLRACSETPESPSS